MSIYEYDQEEHIRLEREDAREEGRKIHLREQVEKKLKKGYSAEQIADALEEAVSTIEKIIEELKQEN